MSKKSVAKNYIFNLMYQILTMIIPLITTPYLSRVLGAEKIGIYSYTLSITTYFILFGSLGISMYGQREIAYLQDKKDDMTRTFYEILFMRFITLGISLILFYLCFCKHGQYRMYYLILMFEIIANSLDISWFFQGIEEFKKTILRNTLVKIISIICIFILVKKGTDLNKYFIIYVLSNFIGNLSLWIYLPKYIKKTSLKNLNIIKHLKPTIWLFIPQIAIQIYTVLDKTMIGLIVSNKAEVGYYEQSQKIVRLLMTIATSLSTVMMPRIANTFATGDNKKLKKYMDKSFSFVTILVFPLMFGISSVASHFVPVFYGPGFEKVKILIAISSPIIVFVGFSNVLGTQYLLPTKQQTKYTISVTVGAFVNFILNIFLIRIYKSVGACVATVFAEFSVTATQFYLVKEQIKCIELINKSFKYITASIIMVIFSIIISFLIKNHIIAIFTQIVTSIIIYFGLLFIMKDEFFISTIKLLNKRKKLRH